MQCFLLSHQQVADYSAALDRLIETGPDGFGTMEREQRHKETEAKLQNLHDENRARAEKLNWVHELAEVADKEAELDAELEPEAERDTREALAVENINRTKFHSQRYERKEMLSTSELARREWKKKTQIMSACICIVAAL